MHWQKYHPPVEAAEILSGCKRVTIASTTDELIDLACGGGKSPYVEVSYEVAGKGLVTEATVARARNGIVVNYPDPYMRRRDPDCMVIGDALPTDKEAFKQRFGGDFGPLRAQTFDWLKQQELMVFGFIAGGAGVGIDALVIVPANAAFFALGLAMLQGIIPEDKMPASFAPRAIVYVAPVFRHTHFDGKQVVVHNRRDLLHEMFSYNLYPGPSAKKGIYGVLLGLGEREGWVTNHCSTVQVITPYFLPDTALIDMGDFVGGMLKYLRRHPVARVTIAGGVGKMTKLAQGLLDLHSKRGSVDLAALAALAKAAGGSDALAQRITGSNTAAEAFGHAAAAGVALGDQVARAARRAAMDVVTGHGIDIEVVLFDRDGKLVGQAPFTLPFGSGG